MPDWPVLDPVAIGHVRKLVHGALGHPGGSWYTTPHAPRPGPGHQKPRKINNKSEKKRKKNMNNLVFLCFLLFFLARGRPRLVRVLEICRRLGLPENVTRWVASDLRTRDSSFLIWGTSHPGWPPKRLVGNS